MSSTPGPATDRFTADCSRCAGLCCVALERSVMGGFGVDDPAGVPCHNLRGDNLCRIHASLREDGWPACVVFDCFGAGQQTVQVTFGGTDWREPGVREPMFAVFGVMRQLMEVLRHLDEASQLDHDLHAEVDEWRVRLETLLASPAVDVVACDPGTIRAEVGELLRRVSAQHRSTGGQDLERAHLLGADLSGQDLGRATLRGALLIAADLSGCRLERADLLGTDLRDANLAGADLSSAIFVTQPQLEQALGDGSTRLPPHLRRPDHWPR